MTHHDLNNLYITEIEPTAIDIEVVFALTASLSAIDEFVRRAKATRNLYLYFASGALHPTGYRCHFGLQLENRYERLEALKEWLDAFEFIRLIVITHLPAD